jgi:hypothetical protein
MCVPNAIVMYKAATATATTTKKNRNESDQRTSSSNFNKDLPGIGCSGCVNLSEESFA